MKKETILALVLVCFIFAGAWMFYKSKKETNTPQKFQPSGDALNETAVSSGIQWQDYKKAISLAKEDGKHIFLYFHADWCPYCTKLTKTTFNDKKVQAYLAQNFISISADTDAEKKLASKWNVRGLPTLWFLAPDNAKISSISGYVDKKQFLLVLKYIHTKSYENMRFHDFLKQG